jgi:hypothetical protein
MKKHKFQFGAKYVTCGFHVEIKGNCPQFYMVTSTYFLARYDNTKGCSEVVSSEYLQRIMTGNFGETDFIKNYDHQYIATFIISSTAIGFLKDLQASQFLLSVHLSISFQGEICGEIQVNCSK